MRKFMNLITENEDIEVEADDPISDARYEQERKLEKAIRQFCEQELNWSFDSHSYPINVDLDEHEVALTPDNEEVTCDELQKLKVLGQHVKVSSSSKPYALIITVKLHEGLNISRA
jgi:hypothetical protein